MFQNLSGKTINQYQILELLGSGGMAAVYRAYQTGLHRHVAIKVISPVLVSEGDYQERFYREARTSAALEHSNIVPVYDFGTVEGLSYVVMRLLAGGSLEQRIRQRQERGQLLPSLHETSRLLNQIASALDYAHGQGVIHRDIKASNIMFDSHGNAFVVDFGIARLLNSTSQLTGTGVTMGTPLYMAPEQWRSEEILPATDQYSAGVLLYLLLTGDLPFKSDTTYGLMYLHFNQPPTPPHNLREDIPEGISQVIERALAKEPKDRFPNMTAFARSFEQALSGYSDSATQFMTYPLKTNIQQEVTATKDPNSSILTYVPTSSDSQKSITEPPAPVSTRSLKPSWLIAGAVVGILLILGVIFTLSRNQPESLEDQLTRVMLNLNQTVSVLSQTPNSTLEAVIQDLSPSPEPSSASASATSIPDASTPVAIAQVVPTTTDEVTPEVVMTETSTPTETSTFTSTPSNTPVPPSATSTDTATSTVTPVPSTETPTFTSTPSNTPVPPSATPTASNTPSITPSATSTNTATPTVTPVPPSATPTASNTPTVTPSATSTNTATSTVTPVPPSATPTASNTPTVTPSATSTNTATPTPTATATVTPSITLSPTETPNLTATADSARIATRAAGLNIILTGTNAALQSALPQGWIGIVTATENINVRSGDGTSFASVGTLSPGQPINILEQGNNNEWFRIALPNGTEGWVFASFVQIIGTATPSPTLDAQLAVALLPVAVNGDWTPVIQTFNGAEMVLVPVGCFSMGTEQSEIDLLVSTLNTELFKNEGPQSEICFDQPFWIDRYEVSNGQFQSLGGQGTLASMWPEENNPREQISWFEAKNFCEARGARLPTEAEWEYAARGPDGLAYPYGNEFTPEGGNYCDDGCPKNWADIVDDGYDDRTAPVGSYPNGVSWVGAEDLSGNVWEWVSSIYDPARFPYPYNANDGRNDLEDTTSDRVQRGGAWEYGNQSVRSAARGWGGPNQQRNIGGFRCVRSF